MEDRTDIATDLTSTLCVFANAVTSDELSGKATWLCMWVQGFKVQVELWKILHEDPRWLGAQGPLAPTRFNPDRWVALHDHRQCNPSSCLCVICHALVSTSAEQINLQQMPECFTGG